MSERNGRRQPLLQSHSLKAGTRLGEVVGGATAICCCCPCGLANILVLAIYKVPAGLYRRLLKENNSNKKKKKKKQKRRQQHRIKEGLGGCDENDFRIHPLCAGDVKPGKLVEVDIDNNKEAMMELEKEMWDKFYGTGFWRSSSQRYREDSSSHTLTSQ